ncbi:MAG: PAS domain S-box protein [Longimicrobiales bacterium]|nr:PAS domain S-box protein [Longimicrobiales bacterium]
MTGPSHPAAFLRSTPLVPIELELDGRVRYVGDQARDLLGFATDTWQEDGFWSRVVVPDDQATVSDARRNTVQARGRHEVDYRAERSDGRIVWIAELLSYADGGDHGSAHGDAVTGGGKDGDVVEGAVLRGFLWDVSGRKRQEVALWKAEERIRGLIRRAPDALVLTDTDGRVLNMNDQAEALFNYSLSEIVGSSIEHLLPEPLRPRLAELREAFERDPQRRSLVEGNPFAVQRSDGNEIPVEISLSRVSGDDEEGRILWAARDLTVRRRVEAQRKAEARHATTPPMSCAVGADDVLLDADEPFSDWFAAGDAGLRGRPVHEVLGRRLTEELRGAVEGARDGRAARLRTELQRSEGDPVAVEVAVAPRYEPAGTPAGYWMVFLPV